VGYISNFVGGINMEEKKKEAKMPIVRPNEAENRRLRDLRVTDRGTIKEDKKLVTARGIRKVPYTRWEYEIMVDPTGPTAQLAIDEKDPDLGKAVLRNISLECYTNPKEVTPESKVVSIPERTRTKDNARLNIDPEEAKRRGWVTAEYGKQWRGEKDEKKGKDKTSD